MLIHLFKKLIYKKIYINFELFLILESARQSIMKTNDNSGKTFPYKTLQKFLKTVMVLAYISFHMIAITPLKIDGRGKNQ